MKIRSKLIIPETLGRIVADAAVRVVRTQGVDLTRLVIGIGVVAAVVLLAWYIAEGQAIKRAAARPKAPAKEFDPFAGGFPVPPLSAATARAAVVVPAGGYGETDETPAQDEEPFGG